MDELDRMLIADISRIEEELQIEMHRQGCSEIKCDRCIHQEKQTLCEHAGYDKLPVSLADLYNKRYLCNACHKML